jgi:flavocytochrome c
MTDINKAISRRSFLKTAAIAGAATAGAGMLGGLPGSRARAVSAQDVSWTHEADVVVIGSGTGQAAALRAAVNGLSTIVLEKAAFGGGTTGISGGGIWVPNNARMAEVGIPDSREQALEYLSHATFGQSTPELLEAYVDNVNPMVEFLTSQGIAWDFRVNFNDYYPEFPGGVPEGRGLDPISTIEGARGGGALVRMLQQACEAAGVQFLFSTAAQRLIVNADGSIAGVQAESEGQEVNVRAARGVIVASGGFDHNAEMVTHFLRGPLYFPSAVAGNVGDGHRMGMALGANLRNMNEIWGWPVMHDEETDFTRFALAPEIGKPGTVIVNQRGLRFVNEAGPYDAVTRPFHFYDSGTQTWGNIPGVLIVDSDFATHYTLGYQPITDESTYLFKADTLDEIAEHFQIDPANLAATMERYNTNAAQGVDPDFHRGESAFDQLTGGDRTRSDVPHPNLAPVAVAPFYAIRVYPGALGTCGGLQINGKAQVLNVWGEVIPGLYAIGNASGSAMGAGYPGGGSTVGAGMTFGMIAADDLTNNRS